MTLGGIDPEKLKKVQDVTSKLNGIITVNFTEDTLMLALKGVKDEDRKVVHLLLDQMANMLAQQMHAFFAITGEIEEVGEKVE